MYEFLWLLWLGSRLEHCSVLRFWGTMAFWHFFILRLHQMMLGFMYLSGSVNLGKWFYLPNHANIHTVLEYEFKTELDDIHSSIITNFYCYISFSRKLRSLKIGENVTKSSLMIEFSLNVYIGLICIKKWQELSIVSQFRTRPCYCHLWSMHQPHISFMAVTLSQLLTQWFSQYSTAKWSNNHAADK